MLSPEEIKLFQTLLAKMAGENNETKGEGDEPDSDKQVDLFPEPPSEVITDPTMKDTQNTLPRNTEDEGVTKLREAYIRKFARRMLKRIRKDLADGVVPLRSPTLVKEQNERWNRQIKATQRARRILDRDKLKEQVIAEMRASPLFANEIRVAVYEFDPQPLEELYGKGSLEPIHAFHNQQHDIFRKAGNRRKAGRALNKAGRAVDLMDLRNAHAAFRQAKHNLKVTKQFAKGSRLQTRKDKETDV
jgi:hypothetical protein